MSENTRIEWADSTFNPWIGCTKVSIASSGGGGCDHCYAEVSTPVRIMRSKGIEAWGPHGQRQRTSVHNWRQPVAWNAGADAFEREHGRRRRVFCASLADVFDNAVDPQWRADLFDLIEKTPRLDWLLLTKRIGNVLPMLADTPRLQGLPSNVWLGATIVNQAEAERDIPKLLAVRASVRFLSMEPLLGPVDLRFPTKTWAPGRCDHCCNGDRCDDRSHFARSECPYCRGTGRQNFLDWVIVGGESGPGARPMHPDWARSLRDQCAAAGVPFHFKQWGEWAPGRLHAKRKLGHWMTPSGRTVPWAGGAPRDKSEVWTLMYDVGKKHTGRLLDGVEHNGFPEVVR